MVATIRKRGDGWRAEVCRRVAGHDIRKSGTFDTKAEAAAWAARTETEIADGKLGRIPDKTFGQLLKRYRDEVSPTKGGARWETVRINRIVDGHPDQVPPVLPDHIASVPLASLDATHFAAWRDRRLRQVTPASVRREWTLLSHACSIAEKEWRWLPGNPMKEVKRPAPTPPRERRISANEIERLLFALGYERDIAPTTQAARVGAAMLFAIETGMRAGEICALGWPDVFLEESYVTVAAQRQGARKTQATRRNVPLSPEAIRIMQQLRTIQDPQNPDAFQISSTQTLDALFRKAKARAMIEGLHFHDTRHEAITRLAKKLDVLPLARMIGHADLRQLMVYYNETATELAGRLR